jgi:hypothetical protein
MRASAGFAVMFASVVSACSGVDLGTCPPGSDAQQAQGRSVLDGSCSGCHSFKLDSLSKSQAEDMFGKVDDGSMPPSGALSDAETEQVRVFLACKNQG